MKFWRPIHFLLNALNKSENPADRLLIESVRLARPNSAQWSQPVPVLIDTGATDVLLPIGLASELGLPIAGLTPAKFANGQVVDAPIVRADLNFCGLQIADVSCSIGPDNAPALIGMSILKFFDMRLRDGRAQFTVNDEAVTRELVAYAKPKSDDEDESEEE